MSDGASLELPGTLLDAIAERAAALVRKELERIEPYMNAEQAGRYMGSDRERIYDLVKAKKLPAVKDGRKVLVRRTDIDAYLRGE